MAVLGELSVSLLSVNFYLNRFIAVSLMTHGVNEVRPRGYKVAEFEYLHKLCYLGLVAHNMQRSYFSSFSVLLQTHTVMRVLDVYMYTGERNVFTCRSESTTHSVVRVLDVYMYTDW